MPARRMSRRWPTLGLLVLGLGLVSGCGGNGEEDRPSRPSDQDGGAGPTSGNSGGSGADAGSNGAEDGGGEPGGTSGAAGEAGTSEDAGSGGSTRGGSGGSGNASTGGATTAGAAGYSDLTPPATCGNGVLDVAEDCEGEAFAPAVDCQAFGFEGGNLRCSDDCSAITDGCTGTERCYDGEDNDGDMLVDCLDSDDCADACEDPCADVPELADPGTVSGSTTGSANLTDASCSAPSSGSELVYELTAASTGQLDLDLSTHQLLTVSVRTTCDDSGSELGCAAEHLSVEVEAGERLYVVVDGFTDQDAGEFSLSATSRAPNVCGDGALDPGEECEDENTESGDGCSESCELEATESEPNDDVDSADSFSDPYYGRIFPAGDRDYVAVEVSDAPASMRVNTYNVGLGMCGLNLMDSYLEVLDTNGTTLLASDDDGGDGYCARVSTFALPAGTYYVVVRASESAPPGTETFPYRLGVTVDQCGNGTQAAGEQCDDGNTTSGDGCSSVCRLE